MSPVQEKIIRMRQSWVQHGEAKEYLAPPLPAATARLWLFYQGGGESRPENVPSPVDSDGSLQAYIDKSLEGVDLDALWQQREYCDRCRETYRLENTVSCLHCLSIICWRCASHQNNICKTCGGEMY